MRSPVRVDVPKGAGSRMVFAGRPVLEPRRALAQRRDPEPANRCADRGVRDLVDPALLEAAVEMDVTRVRHDLAAGDAGESPSLTRDRLRNAVEHIADDQDSVPLFDVCGGVGQVTAIR